MILSAFSEALELYRPECLRKAMWMLLHRDDAEDAVQTAFLQAYRSHATFRGECPLRVWLLRITINVCHDIHDRRERPIYKTLCLDFYNREDSHEVADVSLDPLRILCAPVLSERVLKAAAATYPADRAALLLRAKGLPYAEIAQRSGTQTGTVKSRISRARRRFKEALAA